MLVVVVVVIVLVVVVKFHGAKWSSSTSSWEGVGSKGVLLALDLLSRRSTSFCRIFMGAEIRLLDPRVQWRP